MDDQVPYLRRGSKLLETASSVLVSSSAYLNDPVLRDWVAVESLRRNGRDIAHTYFSPVLHKVLYALTDVPRVNALFEAERQTNPALDTWFQDRFVSSYTKADLARLPAGSIGRLLFDYVDRFNLELELVPPRDPGALYDYFLLRSAQTHDLEHIMCGAGFDHLGEIQPNFMRIASAFKFFSPELAGEVSKIVTLTFMTRHMRTMLHYPAAWPTVWRCMMSGMRIGEASDQVMLARYEDMLHLSPAEAREALGFREVEEIDTLAASDLYTEGLASELFGPEGGGRS